MLAMASNNAGFKMFILDGPPSRSWTLKLAPRGSCTMLGYALELDSCRGMELVRGCDVTRLTFGFALLQWLDMWRGGNKWARNIAMS